MLKKERQQKTLVQKHSLKTVASKYPLPQCPVSPAAFTGHTPITHGSTLSSYLGHMCLKQSLSSAAAANNQLPLVHPFFQEVEKGWKMAGAEGGIALGWSRYILLS